MTYELPHTPLETKILAFFGKPFEPGDMIVRHYNGEVQLQTIIRIGWGDDYHALITPQGRSFCSLQRTQGWKPYNAANLLKAMKARVDYHEAQTIELWEEYAEAFPNEAKRDDRLEGVNAQLEVTGRAYGVVQTHAA